MAYNLQKRVPETVQAQTEDECSKPILFAEKAVWATWVFGMKLIVVRMNEANLANVNRWVQGLPNIHTEV